MSHDAFPQILLNLSLVRNAKEKVKTLDIAHVNGFDEGRGIDSDPEDD